MATWAIHDAETHFEDLLNEAENVGPQFILREGAERAVVLSWVEYNLLRHRAPSAIEIILNGPALDEDLTAERRQETGSPVAR